MRVIQWISVLGAAFLSGVAFSQTAPQDLKLTIRNTFAPGRSHTLTEYYSGENSRTEMQFAPSEAQGYQVPEQHHAVIRRREGDKIQVYDLDLDAHDYVSYQTDLQGGVAGGAKPAQMKPSGKIFAIDVQTADTGERKEIFGMTARRMVTTVKRTGGPENCYGGNSEEEIDGWYVDPAVLPSWLRPQGSGVGAVSFAVLQGGHGCYDKVEVHRSGPPTGYPLLLKKTDKAEIIQPDKTTRVLTTVSEMEVVEFSRAPLDPALFQVPPDFKKVKRPGEQITYWEWFKRKLHSWFG
jgi:hypothetical protein